MVDVGRERLDVCSRPVLPGFVVVVVIGGGGGGFDGGAVVTVPAGGGSIFVCVLGVFAGVSCTVDFGGFETNEALVSALAFSAASRSAFCCRRIRSTNW